MLASLCWRFATTALSLWLVLAAIAPTAGAEQATRRISSDASDALERGMEIDGVQHADSGGCVVLYDSTLIEDDGPGIGPDASFLAANQRSPVVEVGGPTQVKKILHIDRPGAMAVRLYTSQGVNVAVNGRPRTPAHSPWLALCRGLSLEAEAIFKAGDPPPTEWEPWMKWLNVRYMPRNNFLGKELPVPIEQGFHWDWPDYYVWHDATTPREWSYGHFVSRRSDLSWSINQVRFSAEACGIENTLSLRLGSMTPYLQTYLISIDGQRWKPTDAIFSWPLHPRTNRLEMRVRNTSGIEGPVSSIQVERVK